MAIPSSNCSLKTMQQYATLLSNVQELPPISSNGQQQPNKFLSTPKYVPLQNHFFRLQRIRNLNIFLKKTRDSYTNSAVLLERIQLQKSMCRRKRTDDYKSSEILLFHIHTNYVYIGMYMYTTGETER